MQICFCAAAWCLPYGLTSSLLSGSIQYSQAILVRDPCGQLVDIDAQPGRVGEGCAWLVWLVGLAARAVLAKMAGGAVAEGTDALANACSSTPAGLSGVVVLMSVPVVKVWMHMPRYRSWATVNECHASGTSK